MLAAVVRRLRPPADEVAAGAALVLHDVAHHVDLRGSAADVWRDRASAAQVTKSISVSLDVIRRCEDFKRLPEFWDDIDRIGDRRVYWCEVRALAISMEALPTVDHGWLANAVEAAVITDLSVFEGRDVRASSMFFRRDVVRARRAAAVVRKASSLRAFVRRCIADQ